MEGEQQKNGGENKEPVVEGDVEPQKTKRAEKTALHTPAKPTTKTREKRRIRPTRIPSSTRRTRNATYQGVGCASCSHREAGDDTALDSEQEAVRKKTGSTGRGQGGGNSTQRRGGRLSRRHGRARKRQTKQYDEIHEVLYWRHRHLGRGILSHKKINVCSCFFVLFNGIRASSVVSVTTVVYVLVIGVRITGLIG